MRVIPIVLGAVGAGFLAVFFAARKYVGGGGATISYEPPTPTQGGRVSGVFTADVIASAHKWAQARGVPAQEVLATIYVESRGNPRAWANLSTEDSRGLMQVNIRAWASLLAQNGMTANDLWDVDKNIMIGTYIYAKYRAEVQGLIAQSGCPQSTPIDILTRLYYKGPAYVRKKILACQDASSPYRDADKAIANWEAAKAKVAAFS